MELNTDLNDLVGCPLSLHKLQAYPICTAIETVAFRRKAFETTTASFLT